MFNCPVVAAVPVKNEEVQIGVCLQSLCDQTRKLDRLVLLLNNCTDTTADICRQFQDRFHGIEIYEVTLRSPRASAGEARRRALELARSGARETIILTTDADAILPSTWVEQNMRDIAAGADAVCGMAEIHACDAAIIPYTLHEDDQRETFLLSILDEIVSLLAPDKFDPWPRHQQQSGASIAVRSSVLDFAGGLPRVASGEDRALIDALRLIDARIRHAPDILVRVSGRLEGRAAGGMAETIKRRLICQDDLTDAKLEPAIDAYRRAVVRARSIAVWERKLDASGLAQDLLIDPEEMRMILHAEFFGRVWNRLQTVSPVLQRRRVAFADLPREINIALELRERLYLLHSSAKQRQMAADA
jgi:Glycosyl transferase family 2